MGKTEDEPMHDWESISHVRRDCKLCSAEHNLHLMPVHVHMCLKIPPQYSVAHAIGFLKGKSACGFRIPKYLKIDF